MNTRLRFWRVGRLLLIVLALLMVTPNASAEWKEKVLYSFQGGSDGATPVGGVVFDKARNLYGVTNEGGSVCPSPGCGTVFQLSPPEIKGALWTETVIYEFNGTDGSIPVGGAIIDLDGNLYGTTAYGGSGTCLLFGYNVGCGVVYELSPPKQKGGAWTYAVLYNFQGGQDGLFPWGDLVFDTQGILYGSTQFGGGRGTTCNQYFGGNCGTVFKLSPPKKEGGAWKEKILHRFAGGTDGANPNGGLVLDGNGAIYGTTVFGGYGRGVCDPGGCGTTFELSPPGQKSQTWKKTVLYRFRGEDGATPMAGVVLHGNGYLYGTLSAGAKDANGAVFVLTPTAGGAPWEEATLYRFKNRTDDSSPATLVLFDSQGNLYGTARYGGPTGGNIFRMKPPAGQGPWKFGVLHGFTGPPGDGTRPAAGLVLRKGALYGTTEAGGSGACQGGCGIVFEVRP